MARKNAAAASSGKSSAANLNATPDSCREADTTDAALVALLDRLKVATDPNEIRQLSSQIERNVFHKQFVNA